MGLFYCFGLFQAIFLGFNRLLPLDGQQLHIDIMGPASELRASGSGLVCCICDPLTSKGQASGSGLVCCICDPLTSMHKTRLDPEFPDPEFPWSYFRQFTNELKTIADNEHAQLLVLSIIGQ